MVISGAIIRPMTAADVGEVYTVQRAAFVVLVDLGDHAGLLGHLPQRGQVGLLAGVDDAGHGRPGPVVGAADEQNLLAGRGRPDDHSGCAGQPQRGGTDALPQGKDELGGRHGPTP